MNRYHRIFSAGFLIWSFSYSSFATIVQFEYVRTLALDPEHEKIFRDYGLCFSPCGSYLATTGHNGAIKIWNGDISMAEEPTAIAYDDLVTTLLFHPTGNYLASAGLDPYPTIASWYWDGQQVTKLQSDQVRLSHNFSWRQLLAIDPTGELLASTGHGGKIIIWRWSGTESIYLSIVNPLSAEFNNALVFHPIEKILLCAADDGTMGLLRFDGDEAVMFQTIEKGGNHGHKAAIERIAFHPSGKYFASGDKKGIIKLWQWDGEKAKYDQTLDKKFGHTARINTLTFHPNGQLLGSASNDGTIKLWQLHGKKMKHFQTLPARSASYPGNEGPVWIRQIAFHPGGQIMLSVAKDGRINIFQGGEEVFCNGSKKVARCQSSSPQ